MDRTNNDPDPKVRDEKACENLNKHVLEPDYRFDLENLRGFFNEAELGRALGNYRGK